MVTMSRRQVISTLLIRKARNGSTESKQQSSPRRLTPGLPPPTGHDNPHLARRDARVLAVVANPALDLLGLLAVVVGALELNTKLLNASGASVGNGSDVAVVGVDSREDFAAGGLDVLDGDVAPGAVAFAVAARAVQLAEVLRAEAVDRHGRGRVVLDDLVVGVARSAAFDEDFSRALEAEGVFADVGPPDV